MSARITKWATGLLLCALSFTGERSAEGQTPPNVFSWGANYYGQLADGSNVGSGLPVRTVDAATANDIIATSEGGNFTLALRTSGSVHATGDNSYGQLGNGTTRSQLLPIPVKGPGAVDFLTDVAGVSAGLYHSVAVKTDGTVWAWGWNGYGQLGDDTMTDRHRPVQVKGPGGIGFLSGVIAVEAGFYHTLALKSDGTVWAWGYNGYGELGDGTNTSSTTPVQVVGVGGVGNLTDVTAISGGVDHSLALKADGSVYAWGYNGQGQLGDGTVGTINTPVQVVGVGGVGNLTNVVSISAGDYHSMVCRSDGSAYGFGWNAYGQIGDNTTTDSPTPMQVVGIGGVGTLSDVVEVSAGLYHSMARRADGTAYAWGYNGNGELGDGTYTGSNSPVQVVGVGGIGNLTGVTSIHANYYSHAVTSDDTGYGWGYNGSGQIGDGTTTSSPTPVRMNVPNSIDGLQNVVALSSNYEHTLAVKSNGTVFAWGYNPFGALGNDTLLNSIFPVQVKGVAGVGNLMDIVAVSTGYYHSVGLKSNGTVFTWGYNAAGELGDGSYTSSNTPVQVLGVGGIGLLTNVVSLGSNLQSNLAVLRNGTVVGWGYNGNGQLGDTNLSSFTTPTPVTGPNGDGTLTGIIAVSLGIYHSLALGSDGTVWAFGDNSRGQLGDGTTLQHTLPARVKGVNGVGFLENIVDIKASFFHNLALKADGTVYAWGENQYGQLGDNTTTQHETPVQVKGAGGAGFLSGVVVLSAGYYHSSVIRTDGSVWSWGYNGNEQLGNNTTLDSLTPLRTLSPDGNGFLDKIIGITSGAYFNNAIRAEGAIGGSVNLQNVVCAGAEIRFVFRDLNGGPDILRTVTAGLTGVFSFTDIPEGRYDIAIKGSKWLQQVIRNVITEGGANILNLRVFLRGGDSNDDNWIDVFDLDALVVAFNATPMDAHWNESADFNCDESVDVFDLDILIQNFNLEGDA